MDEEEKKFIEEISKKIYDNDDINITLPWNIADVWINLTCGLGNRVKEKDKKIEHLQNKADTEERLHLEMREKRNWNEEKRIETEQEVEKLKDYLKYRVEYCRNLEDFMFTHDYSKVVPKVKIEKKIKELSDLIKEKDNSEEQDVFYDQIDIAHQIETLRELLEDDYDS